MMLSYLIFSSDLARSTTYICLIIQSLRIWTREKKICYDLFCWKTKPKCCTLTFGRCYRIALKLRLDICFSVNLVMEGRIRNYNKLITKQLWLSKASDLRLIKSDSITTSKLCQSWVLLGKTRGKICPFIVIWPLRPN